MKIINKGIILSVLLGLLMITVACNSGSSGGGEPLMLTAQKADFTFQEDQIYDLEIVQNAITGSSEEDKITSEDFLKEAKTKEQSEEKIQRLLKSILAYPTAEGYLNLGQVHQTKGNYEEAIKAFDVSLKLKPKMREMVYYSKACAAAMANKIEKANKCLALAFVNGLQATELFLSDENLQNVRGTEGFMAVYDSNYTENELALFDVFIKSFKQQDLPLKIGAYELNENQMGDKQIASHFEDFVPELKDVLYDEGEGDELYFGRHLGTIGDSEVVVYSGKPSYSQTPTYYMLAVYNQEGTLKNKLLLAGKEKWSDVFYGKVDTGFKLYISEMKVVLEDNQELPVDSPNNRIVSDEVLGTQTFIIDEEGKIIEAKDY